MSEETKELPRIPVSEMSVESTLPKDWQEGTFVGRVMLPGGHPAIVRLEKDGTLTDITDTFPTMSVLCNENDPTAAAKAPTGKNIGKLQDILDSTPSYSNDKPRLIAPIDQQTVKAAGVTFAASLRERAVDEMTAHIPNDPAPVPGQPAVVGPKQAAKNKCREELVQAFADILGGQDVAITAGSDKALKLLHYLIGKPNEVENGKPCLGLSKHYFEVGLGEMGEIFTKADDLASVGSGVAAGFLVTEKYGLNNPEPEAVLITSHRKNGPGGRIIGAALGNDINHRTIEGLSALLLGECKNQNGTCAVGPFIRLFDDKFTLDDVRKMDVNLEVTNNGKLVAGGTNVMSKISRDPQVMVDQMYSNNKSYKNGAVLFCGTMHVPTKRDDGSDFTHLRGDITSVSSSKLGKLTNVMLHCTEIPQPELSHWDLTASLARRGIKALMDLIPAELRATPPAQVSLTGAEVAPPVNELGAAKG